MKLFDWLNPLHQDRPQSSQDAATRSPFEKRLFDIGSELIDRARSHEKGLLSAAFWSDRLMAWAMKDVAFKVQLFRFVDTYPTLHDPESVRNVLDEYLSQPDVTLPTGLSAGLATLGALGNTQTKTIQSQIESMASKFIAGRDITNALPKLEKRWQQGIATSIDLLGEACISTEEAAQYRRRYEELIRELGTRTAQWDDQPVAQTDHLGDIPRGNVSIKISSLATKTDPADFDRTVDVLTDAIAPLLQMAQQHNVFVNFDMEHHALKDLTLSLFERCCQEYDFHAGLALQAYLRSGPADAQRLIDFAKYADRKFTVRLVKGAYWDYEIAHAEQMGWPIPVWTHKADTDACFERMTKMLLAATPREQGHGGTCLALGSHNARSIAAAKAHLEELDLPINAIELQMLYGMADPLKTAAAEMGFRLREYVPVGELIPGMAYLVRRLLENTSNESWLRAGFSNDAPLDELLACPDETALPEADAPGRSPDRHKLTISVKEIADGEPFLTEPPRDFSDATQRETFAEAISNASIEPVEITSDVSAARDAVTAATESFIDWRQTTVIDRARMLEKAADLMREQRDHLAGQIIRESGKTWQQADGDVCEAIDFLSFYARAAVDVMQPRQNGWYVAELNQTWREPRGVGIVISPWNFPLAICTGMTAAMLVTGNCAIVKPAEQTPAIAKRMCELLWQAGVPAGALQYLPGEGETVGAALVNDPRTALVAFTGSKQVGLQLIRQTGDSNDQQAQVKKIVCEMGGKNAIIVDDTADLDEAVVGVRDSAFIYAGQKCSACSRVIVHQSIYAQFINRLGNTTKSLVIGDPLDPTTDIGPVIDEHARQKIENYLELARSEANVILQMQPPANAFDSSGKPFVGPVICVDVEPNHRIANEEVFGPVLCVMKAESFEQALEIANTPTFKLTGGVYSRTPSHLEMARHQFKVGNLYLNRGITGALVGRQPFGGFGMSGLGEQAGCADYLKQFTVARTVCENTVRRGFAPELTDTPQPES